MTLGDVKVGSTVTVTKIAGDKNVKVEVVKDEITPEMLEDCGNHKGKPALYQKGCTAW